MIAYVPYIERLGCTAPKPASKRAHFQRLSITKWEFTNLEPYPKQEEALNAYIRVPFDANMLTKHYKTTKLRNEKKIESDFRQPTWLKPMCVLSQEDSPHLSACTNPNSETQELGTSNTSLDINIRQTTNKENIKQLSANNKLGKSEQDSVSTYLNPSIPIPKILLNFTIHGGFPN